jgi:hypothetical protein
MNECESSSSIGSESVSCNYELEERSEITSKIGITRGSTMNNENSYSPVLNLKF